MSGEFLSQIVKTFPHYFLKLNLRSVDKLRQGKVFRRNFVDSELFHSVDVAGDNGLEQIFRLDVEGEYFVVFSAQNHSAVSTFDS